MIDQHTTEQLTQIDYLRSLGVEPAWFGLGFVQLKLNEKHRMHFWHPAFSPDVPEEEIHDHRYDFTSKVLKGWLEHEVFRFEQAFDGNHEMVHVSCDPNNPAPEQAPLIGNAIQIGSNVFKAGSYYTFRRGEFHRTHSPKCVTLLYRDLSKVDDFARVIRPVGAPAVCPFSNPKPVSELWDLIRDCLDTDKIDKPGYHLRRITKGVVGEPSKIREELDEFMDAMDQNVSIMGLVELADMIGAVEAFLEKHHPSISLSDLKAMSDVTKRAFINGRRN